MSLEQTLASRTKEEQEKITSLAVLLQLHATNTLNKTITQSERGAASKVLWSLLDRKPDIYDVNEVIGI